MKAKKPFVLLLSISVLLVMSGSFLAVADDAGGAATPTPCESPNGCVDCHVNPDKDGNDNSLPTVLEGIENHSKYVKMIKVVPDDCKKCHKEGNEKAGSLSVVIHKTHFGEGNKFAADYGGDCRYCHSMDAAAGTVVVKSGKPKE